ncbi:unnamed protein product [Symbiodinium natans]|uniref:Uncharacterized protein n=1 Tax=Symbiodinium natans TaxID=878477 RepID=A0A812QWZ4_9DINO|nr:unnamed protein product [Symbiodinium natans]
MSIRSRFALYLVAWLRLVSWAVSERSSIVGADLELATLYTTAQGVQEGALPSTFQGTCGGDDIISLMRVHESAIMPWHKIFSITDIYIKAQSTEVQHLEAELASADAEIKAASDQKAATVVNDTQVQLLIVQGLTQQYGAAKSFGSVEAAMDVKCGADLVKLERLHHLSDEFRRDDDLFLDYFDVAVDRFRTIVAEYWHEQVVIAHGSVLRTCLQLLNSTLRDDTSDCDELCTQLEMGVHRMSQPGLTREVNLESARMKRERTWLALTAKQSRLLDCMARRTELSAAKDQLDSLDSAALAAWKIEKTFKRRSFRVTRLLEGHRSELKEQHQLMDKLLRALEQMNVQVSQEKVTSDLAEKTDAILGTGIQAFRDKVVQIQKTVALSTFANQLQAKLVLLLLQMRNFFDTGVRAPLKEVGITPQVSYGNAGLGKFPPLRVDAVTRSLEAFQKFCEEEKQKWQDAGVEQETAALQLQLCSLQDIGSSVQDVLSVVNRTQSVVRYRLMQVQDELKEGPKVPGEPYGLSEVLRLFSTTQIAKNYLSQWQVSGNLTSIITSLKASKAQLQSQVQEESAKLTELKQQLLESHRQRSDFINRLEEAIQGQSLNLVTAGDRLQELQNIKRQEGLLQAQLESLAAEEAETEQESPALSRLLLDSATSFIQGGRSGPRSSKVSAHKPL